MYLKELLTGQHHPSGFFLAYLLTKLQCIVGYDGLVLYLVMHVDDTFLAGVSYGPPWAHCLGGY
jgi:hypothetical protein